VSQMTTDMFCLS